MGPRTESPTGASASGSGGERDAGKGVGSFDCTVTSADIERGSIDFVVVDDLVEKLNVAYIKLGVGPSKVFPLTVIRLGEKDYFAYGVHLRRTPEGVNFLVSSYYSTDQWLARPNAVFITLEQLLEERGKKLWDFNYMVAGRFRDQAEELRCLRTVPLADRLSKLEEELACLKEQLARYTNSPHNN